MGLFTPFAYIKNKVSAAPVFNPNDLTNLTFWIDFSDPTFYTTSGTDITEVYSKVAGATSHTLNRVNASNNFYTLSDSLSNSSLKSAKVVTRPTTYRASSWNTADDAAIVLGPKTNTTSNPDGTMFVVYNRGSISTAGYLISRFTGTVDRGVQYNLATGTPQTDIIGYDQNLPTYQYYNTNNDANAILARVNNGTTSTIYNNGELETTGTRNDAQNRTTRQFHNLGMFGSPTAVGDTTPVNIQYCEVIMYNRVLTDSEIATVNAYLSNKWNIALKTPDIVYNNLVSLYDAGNINSYIGSGTAWNSTLVATNPFTLTNGPTFSTNNGGTIVFDGTNDYATRATFSSLNFGTGDFAIEAWVKITGNTSANNDGTRDATIFAAFPESGTLPNTYAFTITGNTTTTGTGLVFGARDASSTFQLPSLTFSFTQNVFYQIGITHIAGVTKFFVNGTSYAASSNLTINLQTGTRPLQIGRLGYGAGYAQHLAGTIGIVRVYSGSGLTDAQILQNYNANSSRI
jgi:hypothetical protein